MGVYFEWNVQACTKSYEDERPAAEGTAPRLLILKLLENLGAATPVTATVTMEGHPVSFCVPAVPSECVRTAEESYLDCPYLTAWEDELLL